eukprot:335258_1
MQMINRFCLCVNHTMYWIAPLLTVITSIKLWIILTMKQSLFFAEIYWIPYIVMYIIWDVGLRVFTAGTKQTQDDEIEWPFGAQFEHIQTTQGQKARILIGNGRKMTMGTDAKSTENANKFDLTHHMQLVLG